MKKYVIPKSCKKDDLKLFRKKFQLTQSEFANLVGVSRQTIERWETSDKEITGPVAAFIFTFSMYPNLLEQLEIPSKKYPIRLFYMFRNEICTIIDVDERSREIQIKNYKKDRLFCAFGKEEHPTFEEYEEFLESRCFPRQRDKMKLMLRELGLPFYDPFLIIEKTEGRMAEDNFWIRIDREKI